MQNFKSIGIIGYGRFAKLLVELFNKHTPDITVKIHSIEHEADDNLFYPLSEMGSVDLIIPAVSISGFKDLLSRLTPHLTSGQTLVDVCSIKLYPKRIMLEFLPEDINAIATHPLFGPATYAKLGEDISGQAIVVESLRAEESAFNALLRLFERLKLKVIHAEAGNHDKEMGRNHFLSLFMALVLKEIKLSRGTFETHSISTLVDFMDMISVDKDLVKDLYHYNPYCKEELEKLLNVIKTLSAFVSGRNLII